MAFLNERGLQKLWSIISSKLNERVKKEEVAAEITKEESNPVSGTAVYNYISSLVKGETVQVSLSHTGDPTTGTLSHNFSEIKELLDMGQNVFLLIQNTSNSNEETRSIPIASINETLIGVQVLDDEGGNLTILINSDNEISYEYKKVLETEIEAAGTIVTGQTFYTTWNEETGAPDSAEAGEGAEIFNDYRERPDLYLDLGTNNYLPSIGNVATGEYSHAEGKQNTATGNSSHTEGCLNISNGFASHTEGEKTVASGQSSHAEGNNTKAIGLASHAEGQNTKAIGDSSHSEGWRTTAGKEYTSGDSIIQTEGDHAEGGFTKATGGYAHAEGWYTSALGESGHSQGSYTVADGQSSFSGGEYNNAKGMSSVVLCDHSVSAADSSFTAASYALNEGESAHVEGIGLGVPIHVTGEANTTIYTVNEDNLSSYFGSFVYVGNKVNFKGEVATITETNATNGTFTLDKTLSEFNAISNEEIVAYLYPSASGIASHAEGSRTQAIGDYSHSEGIYSMAQGVQSHAEGYGTKSSGNTSHAEGERTIASGTSSHAEGGYYSVEEGEEVIYNEASGYSAHVEGSSNKAIGNGSHAEGGLTRAEGWRTHAEGYHTIAAGDNSHAQGQYTTASKAQSFSGGYNTISEANNSTALGHTVLTSAYQSFSAGMNIWNNSWCGTVEGVGLGVDIKITGSANATTYTVIQDGTLGNATFKQDAKVLYQGVAATVSSVNLSAKTITLDKTLSSTALSEANAVIIPNASASADACHVEGYKTRAISNYSHAEGNNTIAGAPSSHAEGYWTSTFGTGSHAEGDSSSAEGYASHAEGLETMAIGSQCHAEGNQAKAYGYGSHAEGGYTTAGADGIYYAHAEGENTQATGSWSHTEGQGTQATGSWSHAEGQGTIASGERSHAGGIGSQATGAVSFAGGWYSTSSGSVSMAFGDNCSADGYYSQAFGQHTLTSSYYQLAMGIYNKSNTSSSQLIIGNGSESARANCFRAGSQGVYGNKSYSSSGADYAEWFEWKDGNPNHEDRIGKFVTLDGANIRFATSTDDFILGIISGAATVIGDAYEDQWAGMYLKDIYGREIVEEQTIPALIDDRGIVVVEEHIESRPKLNPNYNNNEEYIPRSKRPEWAVVGMMGKLVIDDDGTCEPNTYCYPNDNGIATKSETKTKYRVMERLDNSHIKVLIIS